jgi:sodium-dependent dicarboxylate transporter 2/3/5
MAISYLLDQGTKISFADWMSIAVPLQLLYLAVIGGVVYGLYRPRIAALQVEIAQRGKLSRREWAVLGIGALTILLWLTSRVHGVPDSIVALLPVVLLLGSGLLGVKEFRDIRWEVLVLIGGGLALGVGMQESGLSEYIVGRLAVGGLPPTSVLLVFLALTALLTTFMSNTATAALLIPVVGRVGAQMGLEALLVIGVGVAASLAMALPVSTPPNAIAYGQGGIKVRDMLLAGGAITLVTVGLTALVGRLWWGLLGYG